ncbi:MAG: dimethyl sulfoxide reductase anchor subunit [Deltaproteobacteria bacterium]|nr:dimethyl sulfoxide reductase anchor subunit [Deltaproteobacteria bacterium]MBW2137829.1 dimethyl sulfoxide reductase anchor subunit [Deltaproteobacteria bacterium]
MKRARLMEYEWMVKYTPQKEWIEGQGVLLCLAFFFSEIGAGIYFISLFLNFKGGWLAGWLITLVLGGLIHLGFLGHPMRAWRILLKPATSELSRGLWVISLFGVIGFFHVLPVVFKGLSWTGEGTAFKTIMGILTVLIITHGFLTMNVVRALPLWNSSMIIPLSVASGIWVGAQTAELMMKIAGHELYLAEAWSRWSLIGYMAILVMYLWGTYHSNDTARESVKRLLIGDSALRFYLGVVVVGIAIPLIITIALWSGGTESPGGGALFIRFLCVLIGDLTMRYSIMKSAIYTPLI